MRRVLTALVCSLLLVLAACGSSDEPSASGSATAERVTLRLGYFPNVTHATAIVGVHEGVFAEALGSDVELKTSSFNAGPAAVEALFAGALDATYIGPGPAINAHAKSNGEAIRIVAGATSGGAALVVKPSITSVDQLKGKKIASPQLGNTQDVALRAFLDGAGMKTDPQGGGDVSIVPQENAQTLETFKAGTIDGAWVPEPWVSRMVLDGGAKVLVDEKDLWPGGKFLTTHLIVRTAFLEEHPDAVAALLRGHVAATEFVNDDAARAQQIANAGIEKLTGKKLADEVITAAWKNLLFTYDPLSASLATSAKQARTVGLLDEVDLDGIYELSLLNQALKAKGLAEIPEPAL